MLTAAEKKRLYEQLAADSAANTAMIVIVAGLAWAVFMSRTSQGFLDRGQLFLISPLALFWLWLLRRAPLRIAAVLSDLGSGETQTIEGVYTLLMRKGAGFVALFRPRAVIGDFEFAADDLDIPQSWQGRRVTARIGAASRVLLSVKEGAASAAEPEVSEADRARLKLMAAGLSDKLIARELSLSPGTVRTYNSALFRKLGAANREEAIKIAAARGLLDVN